MTTGKSGVFVSEVGENEGERTASERKEPELLEADHAVHLKSTEPSGLLLPGTIPVWKSLVPSSAKKDNNSKAIQQRSTLPLVIPGIVAGLIMMVAACLFFTPYKPLKIASAGAFTSCLALINIYWCFCMFKISAQSSPEGALKSWMHRIVIFAVSLYSTNLLTASMGIGVTVWYSILGLVSLFILACHQMGLNTAGWLNNCGVINMLTSAFIVSIGFPGLMVFWYFRLFQRVQKPMLSTGSRTPIRGRLYSLVLAVWFPSFTLLTVTIPMIVYGLHQMSPSLKTFNFPAVLLCLYSSGSMFAFVLLRLMLRPYYKAESLKR